MLPSNHTCKQTALHLWGKPSTMVGAIKGRYAVFEPFLSCPPTRWASGSLCTSGASPDPRSLAVRFSAEQCGPMDL